MFLIYQMNLSYTIIMNEVNWWAHLMSFFDYRLLRQNAQKFLMEDVYRNPGPLQYDGPGADAKAVSLCVEDQDYNGRIKKLQEYLDKVLDCVFIAPRNW